ncbi:photosynthetic reaction center subunit H [Jiella marina]|uniref:photosynthetic reaction center subunit H n=1 Tax=Jiella sp. LLJ827 TaxID=2917712 RepID=UPI0021013A9D|nr:photosynthetic reaction center subunit H [Jiella sp. LLJ827]MCQ0986363.1 PRC-barrel domain-containing protein [Jiella sp. LLJ827]
MPGYSFTEQLDIPLLLVILFFLFFLGLVYYLRGEDKREGYPLQSDRTVGTGGRMDVVGFPPIPKPKLFKLMHGGETTAPRAERPRDLNAFPAYEFPGAPIMPSGDPLVDGIGPASYALRRDTPDLTVDGSLKLVPMRNDNQYRLEETDPHPVGMTVIARDGLPVGKVVDVWINAHEYFPRYLEIEANVEAGGRRVLAPIAFANIKRGLGEIRFSALTRPQFSRIPSLANPAQITMREEDRINGYFAGGAFYDGSPTEDALS